jgi:two-component system NarL family response regulator
MVKIRVLLVDDHLLVLEGLRNLLTVNGFEVVGAAGDGVEALQAAKVLRPDIVLMDVRMPKMDGLEATRRFHDELPNVKVVILTSSEDDETLLDAIKSGASGYLLKSMKPELFVALLQGVVRGEAALLRETAAKVMEAYARQSKHGDRSGLPEDAAVPRETLEAINHLTARQLDILKRVAQGQSYKEIAAALGITKRTVQYHVLEIMQKLKLENRTQIITYATRAQLLDDDELDAE